MFSLLIVDDEMDQADSLADTIDWSRIGVGTVRKAYSAFEALELLEVCAIDIVVTDIRMPEMSGLELIEHLTRQWSNIQVIILSGYSDFKYAQTAVKYNVSEYLLKPVSDDELIEAVTRTCGKLEALKSSYHSSQIQRQFIHRKLPVIKSALLHDLLCGKKLRAMELEEMESTYGIRFADGDRICLLLIRLEGKFKHYKDSDQALISYSIFNMAEELLSSEFDIWHTRETFGYLVVLLKPKLSSAWALDHKSSVRARITRYAEKLRRSVQFYLQGHISVWISGSFLFQDELLEAYRSNKLAFSNVIGELEDIVLAEELGGDKRVESSLQKLYESATLSQLMELGKWTEAKIKLNDTVEELLGKWAHSREHLLEVFYAFSHAVIQFAHSNGLKLSEIDDDHEYLAGKGMPFHTARHFQEWAVPLLDKLADLTEQASQAGRTSLVETINQYIEVHYGEDSTLQALADHVGLHPSYLSKLYKLETGLGISEYRHRLRMEKSLALLKQGRHKIHEISELLGFQNPQYFSKRFKEQFGCTPNEYRDGIVE